MGIEAIQSRINAIESRISQLNDMMSPQAQPQFSTALSTAQASQNPESGLSDPSGQTVQPLTLSDVNGAQSSSALPTSEIDPIVDTAAQKYGVDPQLVKAVIQTESSGNPDAVSKAGAEGLMQLMPSNIADSKVSNPFDPEQNIDAGVSQLSGYMKEYDGNMDQALAAYNAGPGAVKEFHGVPPYQETENYIKKIHGLLGK